MCVKAYGIGVSCPLGIEGEVLASHRDTCLICIAGTQAVGLGIPASKAVTGTSKGIGIKRCLVGVAYGLVVHEATTTIGFEKNEVVGGKPLCKECFVSGGSICYGTDNTT
ncbi:hypothetical protein SDC9_82860 [bioreactor metagenome]|uniref:Uncharacterized protein n=1 Tax=bioreactor metagenome TaxID=1076179 RepID=A0A644Z5T5_9ZZZZ